MSLMWGMLEWNVRTDLSCGWFLSRMFGGRQSLACKGFGADSERVYFFVGGDPYGRAVSKPPISEVEQLFADILKDDDSQVAAGCSPGPDSRQWRMDPLRLKVLDPGGLLRVLRNAATKIARLQALQLRVVAELSEQHQGSGEVAAEVTSVLPLSLSHARKLVREASALTTRLPMTLALMETGALDGAGASKVCTATAWLSDDDARTVDVVLQHRLPGKDADQARDAASYAARKVDPGGAARRTRKAIDSRRVTVTRHRVGTASLALENGSVEKVNAAYDRLDRIARELSAEDEDLSLDQLRMDAALDLLAGIGEADPPEGDESSAATPMQTPTQAQVSARPQRKASASASRRGSRRHRRGRQGKARRYRTRSCSG
jgi:hypothetical protein